MALAAACGGAAPAAGPGPATPTAAPTGAGPTGPAGASPTGASAAAAAVPAPAHIVLVVMENHAYGDIIGNPAAPFINALARRGAVFTRSSAVAHPSEPNYLALFSGATQGVSDDSCPHTFRAPNLGADLAAARRSFTGYAENLPAVGSPVCVSGSYARKHVPWVNFANVPVSASQPFSKFPGSRPAALPTVSFVVPNLCDDMHDCSVATGDAWLRRHLGGYADWAMTHHSLLIVTWDEDDGSAANHIATIFVGQVVRPGRYGQRITHYNVLATIEVACHLRRDGQAATAAPITGVWAGAR
ncbi:MAG TPA: alkaline phosphatase family protein [Streptosporangiaceae bacterium]|nr:alkaline phosphatase family protein [Streptosporangiaceae bacterium]